MTSHIRHGNSGWELVEFARQVPARDAPALERFVYERLDEHGDPCGRAIGYRAEGDPHITIHSHKELT